MPNHRTGLYFNCPNCSKQVYIIKSRVNKYNRHFCSLKCVAVFTAPERGKKQQKKEYPFILENKCPSCNGNIIIKNSSFDKGYRKYCSKSCVTRHRNLNDNPSKREGVGLKISKAKKGKPGHPNSTATREKLRLANLGSKSHFWQGGKTEELRKHRSNSEAREWRKSIFERDNYTCVLCGARSSKGSSVVLNADHIKPWSLFPELRLEMSNGRTLCLPCHRKTDTWGSKTSKKSKECWDVAVKVARN